MVDDEASIVEVRTFLLEKAGVETVVASDGVTALRLAPTTNPDLILLNVMLPGLDGLAVCAEIRKASDVPIILLTARGAEADRVAGLELHADDYVVKPFSTRELVARVHTILRRAAASAAGASQGSVINIGLDEWSPFQYRRQGRMELNRQNVAETSVAPTPELMNEQFGGGMIAVSASVSATFEIVVR